MPLENKKTSENHSNRNIREPGKKHKKQQVSLSDQRAHISFLAFITHDPEVQAKLPQIFLGNDQLFTKKLLNKDSEPVGHFGRHQIIPIIHQLQNISYLIIIL